MPAHVDREAGLQLTGERTLPGIGRENYWFRRHEAAYAWASAWASGRSAWLAVDAGCGEGYGASMLADAAGCCIAVDLDLAAARHVRRFYSQDGRSRGAVLPVAGNLCSLPIRDSAAQLIVSLQVIEHLWDPARFLDECRRVLRPGGHLIISTPNRLTFSPGVRRGERPPNPFHVEEFDADQITGLLSAAGLPGERILGLRHGSRIRDWEASNGSVVRRQVQAILSDQWPRDLEMFVGEVAVSDFLIDDRHLPDSLDLIAVARKPSPRGGEAA